MPADHGVKPEVASSGTHGKVKVFLVSVCGFAVWIFVLNWLFIHYSAISYPHWYLENGILISLATSFFAIVWQGLEEQKDLLSWHPLRFLRSCLALAAIFYSAIAAHLTGPLDGMKGDIEDPVSISESIWDGLFSLIMLFIMGVFVLGWILVIAPMFYLITLFTGAPARRYLRDTGIRLIVKKEGNVTNIIEQTTSEAIPDGAVDVSLGVRPFALTNALNAAVLFLAKSLFC